MMKLTLFVLLVFVASSISAQTKTQLEVKTETLDLKNTTTISDFTVTDSDGFEWNLYGYLNAGKTVILDLFFRN